MARYGRYHLGIGGIPVLRRHSILGRPGSENAARQRTVGVPEKNTARPARKTKSPSTQAGEYVREEIEHVREGKHGARSAKQVIAIGLSKARRAGENIPPPPGKKAPKATGRKPNPTRSRAALGALEGEGVARKRQMRGCRHALALQGSKRRPRSRGIRLAPRGFGRFLPWGGYVHPRPSRLG